MELALGLVAAFGVLAGYLAGVIHACWVLGRKAIREEPPRFQIIRLVDPKEQVETGKPERRQDN